MLENISLPDELNAAIGSENKDFAVLCKRARPVRKSLPTVFFAFFWLAFSGFMTFLFIGPLFRGEEIHFSANGAPKVAGPGNLEPILIPGLILGAFVLIGIGLMVYSIYTLVKKGGFFVGTPTRLIYFKKGTLRSMDWEQFTGNIELKGNAEKGTLTMEMRTGTMVSSKSGSRYVPDVVFLPAIANVFEIEQICRKRIKENDPTPAGGV